MTTHSTNPDIVTVEGLQRENASLVQLVRTMEDYAKQLEARLDKASATQDPTKSDTSSGNAPSSVIRQLNDERKKVTDLEALLLQERREKEALAKESLSQLSKSLGAMQSKASAALVQSHELTETLQLELEKAKSLVIEKDVQMNRLKETLLNEVVRLRRVYEGRDSKYREDYDVLTSQLEQLLKLNNAKDAVFAHEKDILASELHSITDNRSAREITLLQELAVLRSNVEELSVEVVRLHAAARHSDAPDEASTITALQDEIQQLKQELDAADVKRNNEVKAALVLTTHEESMELVSLQAEVQRERDKCVSLTESLELLQRQFSELTSSGEQNAQRIVELSSTLATIRDTYEAEITRLKSEYASMVDAARDEVVALKADVEDLKTVLDNTRGTLQVTEQQLQSALSSKSTDIAELEALISKMHAAHAADNDRASKMLQSQAAELELMTNTASAREKALFDMTQSFSKSENELRGALTRATDALYTCELQKASIEAACLDAIGKMQQQLEQETRLHEQAEVTSSSVISQLQTKVLRLSRECEEAKAQNEDAMNTLDAAWQGKCAQLQSDLDCAREAVAMLEANLKETRSVYHQDRARLEAELASVIAQRDDAVQRLSNADATHAAELQRLKDVNSKLRSQLNEAQVKSDYADAQSTLAFQSDIRKFLQVLSQRAADADGNDDYDSDFTGVTSPGVDVLTPITESPVDDGYRSANNTTSPRRQGSNTKLTARVSRSVAIVQELIDNVHRVTQENSTSLVEFQKAASDELSVLRARAADGGDTVANICDLWEKERDRIQAELQSNSSTLQSFHRAVTESAVNLQSLLGSLKSITTRWSSDQGERDSVFAQYMQTVSAMHTNTEERITRTADVLSSFSAAIDTDRASTQAMNDTILELSRSVVKLVNDASGSTSTGHNFLSELRQLLARHTIAVAQSATEHENVLMDEIGKLKEQLLDTQQAKIDGELRLLSDKRQLLKELQSIKARQDDEKAAVTDTIKKSRQRWEMIANDRETAFQKELSLARSQVLRLQDAEKDMEYICRNERDVANRAAALLRKSVGIEREFVSAEMQTFVTFLETIQSNASLLFRCHMADLAAMQGDVESLRQLIADKEAVHQSRLKTLESAVQPSSIPTPTSSAPSPTAGPPTLKRGATERVLTISSTLPDKLKIQDDVNMKLLNQEIERLTAELDETRSRSVEKDSESIAHIQVLTRGLQTLSETFQAYMQRQQDMLQQQQQAGDGSTQQQQLMLTSTQSSDGGDDA